MPGITPEGAASTGAAREQLIPKDTNERLAYARRLIAQRCLYGVDKNPLAVEMAKLSIWLLTLAKDKPFTFLDHAIRCGDSLVGIRDIRQVQFFQLDFEKADRSLFTGPILSLVDEAVALRKKIEILPANTIDDVREKERLLKEAEDKTARINYAADLLISVEFQPAPEGKAALHQSMAIKAGELVANHPLGALKAAAEKALHGQRTFHWALEFPEVVIDRGGFDAFVCNPPFMGGTKLEPAFGRMYREHLVSIIGGGIRRVRGTADLCVYFLLRASTLLRPLSGLGMITTNTVAEGDSREVGLQQLYSSNWSVIRAIRSCKWPGSASLEVSCVWMRNDWAGDRSLDGNDVRYITPLLNEAEDEFRRAFRLTYNSGLACIGSKIYGQGFVLNREQAESFIEVNPRCREVIYPYLIGQELNTDPIQAAGRLVIFFGHRTEFEAREYEELFTHVERTVRPERASAKQKNPREKRWQFEAIRQELYDSLSGLDRVLIKALTSKHHALCFVPTGCIYDQTLIVFFLSDWHSFSVLQSNLHGEWSLNYGPKLETRPRYTISECFETFPFPQEHSFACDTLGKTYHDHRRQIMLDRQEGLTKTYNRFHDPDESSADIQRLRDLHVEMDQAVAAAYGWSDLDLGHGFHETKQGLRFTISESARREVLARLLKLNHERYAEEVAQGLHEKKGKPKTPKAGSGRKSKASSGGTPLFGGDDEADPDPADVTGGDPSPAPGRASSRPARSDLRIQRPRAAEPPPRPTPIDEIETDAIMAAFRQAARGRGRLDRDELLKDVSLVLGYQRLGPKIEEALRGHLRAAIRRRIIEADGPDLVRAGTTAMADYDRDELREVFRSIMRKGTSYEREEIIHALARHLGFVRVTDTIRQPIKSAINSAIRHGLLGYEGSAIWRED